jgi:hypothetical protein
MPELRWATDHEAEELAARVTSLTPPMRMYGWLDCYFDPDQGKTYCRDITTGRWVLPTGWIFRDPHLLANDVACWIRE